MQTLDNAIGGKLTRSASARTAPVFNPATGEQSAVLPLSTAAELDAAVAGGEEGASPPGPRCRRSAAPSSCSPSRRCSTSNQDRIAEAISRRARQDPRRRAGRIAARHRGGRFLLRHPASAEGRVLAPRRPGHRHPFRPPAARRRRRHHAVQLPGHGADVDVSGRDRLRQHLHPQAVGARPLGVDGRSASCSREAGFPEGVLNVVHGDKEVVDAILDPPRHQGGVASSARRRSPNTSTGPAPRTGSASRRSAAPRTT